MHIETRKGNLFTLSLHSLPPLSIYFSSSLFTSLLSLFLLLYLPLSLSLFLLLYLPLSLSLFLLLYLPLSLSLFLLLYLSLPLSLSTRLLSVGSVEGFADDYANYVCGLLDLFDTTQDVQWVELANQIQLKQLDLFWDQDNGGLYNNTASDPTILLRMKEGSLLQRDLLYYTHLLL